MMRNRKGGNGLIGAGGCSKGRQRAPVLPLGFRTGKGINIARRGAPRS